MSDGIIESNAKETKTVAANFHKEKVACKTQKVYIVLAFLLITVALLIAVSIYCYLINYWGKQKHLLPFHVVNKKLKKKYYY